MSKYRFVIIRPGQLRAPLFPGHWDEIGSRLKRGIDATCSDIDHGTRVCIVCCQRIWAHDNKTAFPTEVKFKDGGDIELSGGACCQECSQLNDGELLRRLYE
jgi:hypothetical protein